MGNGFLSHHAPPGASPGAAGYHPRASPLYNTVDNMVLYVVYEYNGIQMAIPCQLDPTRCRHPEMHRKNKNKLHRRIAYKTPVSSR